MIRKEALKIIENEKYQINVGSICIQLELYAIDYEIVENLVNEIFDYFENKKNCKNCKLHPLDPYFHLKNDRWVIWYSNNEHIYLCLTPYSEWCKYYLERKGVIKK